MTVLNKEGRGTALGVVAIVLWAAAHSLIRLVSEAFGPLAGPAFLYSLGTFLLIALSWRRPVKAYPIKYLVVGGFFFVAYEVSLALALGLAQSRKQTLEVSLINYLWPCLTAAMVVVSGRQRASWFLYPGFALSFFGIAWIIGGQEGLSITGTLDNALKNPVSYGLALLAAFLWAFYCFFARGLAQGSDAIVPFFAGTSVVLWGKFLASDQTLPAFDFGDLKLLLIAAFVLAIGHAFWNRALASGNLLMLAALSYAIPVLSTLVGSAILMTMLDMKFWQGVALVTLGSLVCWWATRSR